MANDPSVPGATNSTPRGDLANRSRKSLGMAILSFSSTARTNVPVSSIMNHHLPPLIATTPQRYPFRPMRQAGFFSGPIRRLRTCSAGPNQAASSDRKWRPKKIPRTHLGAALPKRFIQSLVGGNHLLDGEMLANSLLVSGA